MGTEEGIYACPGCGKDLREPRSVMVEYVVTLPTRLEGPDAGPLLHEIVDVAENAEEALPARAFCAYCGGGIEGWSLAGSEWEE